MLVRNAFCARRFETRTCMEANAHNLLAGNYGVTRSAGALAKL